MQDQSREDPDHDSDELLHAIVDEMLKPFGKTSQRDNRLLLHPGPPFDTSRPNEHDTKADFLREKKAVQDSLRHVAGLVQNLMSQGGQEDHEAMLSRLRPIIDQKLRDISPKTGLNDGFELVRKNVADVGGFTASALILLDLWTVLADRSHELKSQEEKFWDISHRAPNYYARAIALRLAKLYSREAGLYPTSGTSGTTGEPSTSYTRALEKVFKLLDIKSAARSPAEWAIEQLTEDDLRNDRATVLGGLLGYMKSNPQDDTKQRIVDALAGKGVLP